MGLAVEWWLRRRGKHLKGPAERGPDAAPSPERGAARAEPRAPTRVEGRPPERRHRGVGKDSYLRGRLECQGRRSRKLELYERATQLRDEGYGVRSIARQIGVARSTLQDWLGEPGFPTRRAQVQGRLFEGHLEYVKSRIEEPELSTMQLHWELLERGYAGSLTGLYALVASLRAGMPPTPDSGSPVQRLRPAAAGANRRSPKRARGVARGAPQTAPWRRP